MNKEERYSFEEAFVFNMHSWLNVPESIARKKAEILAENGLKTWDDLPDFCVCKGQIKGIGPKIIDVIDKMANRLEFIRNIRKFDEVHSALWNCSLKSGLYCINGCPYRNEKDCTFKLHQDTLYYLYNVKDMVLTVAEKNGATLKEYETLKYLLDKYCDLPYWEES